MNGITTQSSEKDLISVSDKAKNLSIKDTALVEEGDSRRVSTGVDFIYLYVLAFFSMDPTVFNGSNRF